jgi:hypothetical protein
LDLEVIEFDVDRGGRLMFSESVLPMKILNGRESDCESGSEIDFVHVMVKDQELGMGNVDEKSLYHALNILIPYSKSLLPYVEVNPLDLIL